MYVAVLSVDSFDMTVCFISCLLKPFRVSLNLPRFPSCCATLRWSPAVLNDITKPPRVCIVFSARESSYCRSQSSSFPRHGHPLQLFGVTHCQRHHVQGTQQWQPYSVLVSLSPTLMGIYFSL